MRPSSKRMSKSPASGLTHDTWPRSPFAIPSRASLRLHITRSPTANSPQPSRSRSSPRRPAPSRRTRARTLRSRTSARRSAIMTVSRPSSIAEQYPRTSWSRVASELAPITRSPCATASSTASSTAPPRHSSSSVRSCARSWRRLVSSLIASSVRARAANAPPASISGSW